MIAPTVTLLLATCTLVLGLAFLRELRLRRGLQRLLRQLAEGRREPLPDSIPHHQHRRSE